MNRARKQVARSSALNVPSLLALSRPTCLRARFIPTPYAVGTLLPVITNETEFGGADGGREARGEPQVCVHCQITASRAARFRGGLSPKTAKNVIISPVSRSNNQLDTDNSASYAARWRDFVAASPFGDVLQTLEWGPVKRPEWTPLPVAIENDDGIEASALVLQRKLIGNRTFFYLPRGPILDWQQDGLPQAMLERLQAEAQSRRAAFIKIDPCVPDQTPGVKEKLGALGFGFSPDATGHFGGTQPRCNMKLSLAGSLDDIQARFHQKWRYNIRLAAKKGISVTGDTTREDLEIFHSIYRVTAGRNEFTGRPLSYFQKMWDALVPAGLMKLFVTTHDGQPLSAAICFLLPPQCWYIYGASSNEKRNLMPNHLMQWTMIQWAKENNCELYDFRGVPDPDAGEMPPGEEGLVRFKTGFGAELVRYIGEYDLPLDKNFYWLWTSARPRLVGALKKLKR